MSREGYVYLLSVDDNFYKIGKAKDVKGRIRQLRKQYSHKFKLVHAFYSDDAFKWESHWHCRFAECLVDGRDWFYLFPVQVDEFCLTPSIVPPKPPRRVLSDYRSRRFLTRLALSVIRSSLPIAA